MQIAQPAIAQRALAELRREVVDREAGRVKNSYMMSLGNTAALIAVPALLGGFLVRAATTFDVLMSIHGVIPANALANTLFLVAGCVAGVWMSFGARKAIIEFDDLAVPEKDYLLPRMRVAFAELVTLSLALCRRTPKFPHV